jgi:5'-3' exonuclease
LISASIVLLFDPNLSWQIIVLILFMATEKNSKRKWPVFFLLFCTGDCASFTLGRPFLPFQQLLGVLPPLSSALLPPPYRTLMTNPASPVYEFFQEEIKLDMEGKR